MRARVSVSVSISVFVCACVYICVRVGQRYPTHVEALKGAAAVLAIKVGRMQ